MDNHPPANMPRQPERAGLTRERVSVVVLALATALALWLCYLLVQPFIPVLAWALALAIVARPIHSAIVRRVRQPDVAAGLAVLGVAGLIIGPAFFVLHQLVQQATAAAKMIQKEAQTGEWLNTMLAVPWIGRAVELLHENVDVRSWLHQIAEVVAQSVPSVVAGSVWAVVQMMFVMFTLYFLFRDRDQVVTAVRGLLPLSEAEATNVLTRVADTIHATIYGSLFVALIQGTMGGLMFWFLGLPSPVFWGAVMCVMAVVPNLGTFIVWTPVAIYLAATGEWGKALVLAVWGAIAIGFIDNLLYPYLVGSRMRLHTLPVFFAILGGLALMGAVGVVLGPVIVAVTQALIDVWRRRTADGRAAESGVGATGIVLPDGAAASRPA